MKSLETLGKIYNKNILLRLDLNVPILNGKIIDTNRIDKIIPTIKFLLNKKSKIIIITHIGRPKGKKVRALSLRPICEELKNKLKRNVKLVVKSIHSLNKSELSKENKEDILVLENIRFYLEEEKNEEKFSKKLASLGDIYVNDAFSCSHREHASICNITKYIPSYSGLQINSEIEALKKITTKIKKPITCIIGGSKISSKINIIRNLIPRFNNIIFVGGMANNILRNKGIKIGKSIYEESSEEIINQIFFEASKYNCKLFYPIDVKVGKSLNDTSKIKEAKKIDDEDIILDLGPKTINKIIELIKNSSTILWNGPAGYFENPNFAEGSEKIARCIADRRNDLYSVAGGGDTVAVLNSLNLIERFNFVSTAGGAFLEYLEGKILPGIKALK